MRFTRRFWSVSGVGLALAVYGVVIAEPVLVIGAGAIGAWLLIAQYRFLSQVTAVRPNLTVQIRPEQDRVTARETTQILFTASVAVATDLSMHVTATTPVGVDGTLSSLTLDADGNSETTQRATVSWPVAGEFAFERPRVTFLDGFGLFRQTLTHGDSPTVVVEPRVPRDIHVGKGGEALVSGFGDHETDQTGSGLKPAEIRQYLPGDPVRQIDWKATARLAEPHVREFEVQTDWETRLFVDHRQSMDEGPDGERKLDYARQLLLALLTHARRLGDPVGCYTIGEEGVTAQFEPAATSDQLRQLRSHIVGLSPIGPTTTGSGVVSPATVRERTDRLGGDDSAFGETLRPFFDNQTQYVSRVASQPLFEAIRQAEVDQIGTGLSVIVTDDHNQAETREAVKIARQTGGHVSVYLTPTILYEEGALRDLATAYEQYVAFESFRRDLDSIERVSAFEVGPGDRVSAILTAGRRSRETTA
jgi:uncharacterized protein (DUF58 family)